MQGVADRALKLIETKVIRHVRTEAGVRRYKQPIGSIIMNNGLLVGITEVGYGTNYTRLQGDNGKHYRISTVPPKRYGGIESWKAVEEESGKVIYQGDDQTAAYAYTAKHVQEEAGIDTRGPGGLPGAGGKREGWSENQLQAASDEISMWGNAATDDGNNELADELWNIAGNMADGYAPHRDARVARHQLEQLKKRADLRLDEPNLGEQGKTKYGDLVDRAIDGLVSEAKLPKRYNEAVEKDYADRVLAEKEATVNVPQPVKVADIHTGQWVRKVHQDDTRGPWFKVTSVASQSRTGRSKMITGRDQDGKLVRHTQQGPRDRYESVDDPKTAAMAPGEAEAHQAAAEREARVPDQVAKPVYRLRKGDYTTLTGTVDGKPVTTTGYVADDYVDKDDWSSPERRKRPVYKVEMSDDKAGKVNHRVVVVPKGTMSGPAEESEPAPATSVASNEFDPNDLDSYPDRPGGYNFVPQKTDYPGYDKILGANGRVFYLDRDETGTDIYDENDKLLAQVGPGAAATLDKLQELSAPKQVRSHVTEHESEYDGYKKFVGANGEEFYVAKEGRETVVYDGDDNVLFRTSGERTALNILNERAQEGTPPSRGAERVAEVPKEVPAQPAVLKRLKSKYDGWKRFKLPDGRVVDTGQATDDDGRWYATGKGGWDDIIADGDSEDEMMTKLRAIAAPSDTPVSFSPGNTDVAPRRASASESSPVMGMTRAEYNRAIERANKNPGLRASVLGTPDPTLTERALAKDVSPTVPVSRASGQPSRIAPMTQLMAARHVHALADDFEPSSTPYVDARNVARALEENKISTEEASRVLNVRARQYEDDYPDAVEKFRRMATDVMNYDWRTRDEVEADARAKRQQALRDARRDVGEVNKQVRQTLAAQPDKPQTGSTATALSKLDTGTLATRAGKPLTDADRKMLNMHEYSNGRKNRVKPPANTNLNNRLNRLAPNDAEAYEAIQDRATENYLNGATQAAAWKEAITTAEDMVSPDKVPHAYSQRKGGAYIATLKHTDGTYEEFGSYGSAREALGVATREQNTIRADILRRLPVAGAPDPTIATPKPPTATTAGGNSPQAQLAERMVNAPLPTPSVKPGEVATATESMRTFRSLNNVQDAERLARENPAHFVEAMAEGGFGSEARRQEHDRVQAKLATEKDTKARTDLRRISTATQKRMRENYELLRRGAAEIRSTGTASSVEGLLYTIRLKNQGMMGADARKMMAIYDMLKRVQGL